MAAKKKTAKKSGAQPPKPPKDTSIGKTPPAMRTPQDIRAAESARQQRLAIREQQERIRINRGEGMQMPAKGMRPTPQRVVRQMESQLSQMESKLSGMTKSPKAVDKLSGRTVEFGTRSMLEGIRGWMRGGGGLRSHGK